MEAALDVLALADLAWHDLHGELEVPEQVFADLMVVSRTIVDLVRAANLAVTDWRGLRMNADAARGDRPGSSTASE